MDPQHCKEKNYNELKPSEKFFAETNLNFLNFFFQCPVSDSPYFPMSCWQHGYFNKHEQMTNYR